MAIATVPRLSVPPVEAWCRRIAVRLRPMLAFNTVMVHRNQAMALPGGGGGGRYGGPGVRVGSDSCGIRRSWLTVCAGGRRAGASIRQLAEVAAQQGRIASGRLLGVVWLGCSCQRDRRQTAEGCFRSWKGPRLLYRRSRLGT
jgi:hypothetical protein